MHVKCTPACWHTEQTILGSKDSWSDNEQGWIQGAGLDKMTNKPQSGKDIPRLYDEKNYGEIESYIKKETESFCEWLAKLYVKLPKLRDELL